MDSIKISGVIITYNEESNIARCLNSLMDVCDEIIVVDSFSTDKTKEICIRYDVTFIEHAFAGHIEQKNFAVSQAKNNVVLSLDADEELSETLKQSILEVKQNWATDAYYFNRLTNFCGAWIKHSGWYPDAKTRLWDKRYGTWGGENPHDTVIITSNKPRVKLKGDLFHYSFHRLEDHALRAAKYAEIAAKAMHQRGKKSSIGKAIGSALILFIKSFFFKLGFLDGFYGIIICVTSAHTSFLKYVYLHELNKKAKH